MCVSIKFNDAVMCRLKAMTRVCSILDAALPLAYSAFISCLFFGDNGWSVSSLLPVCETVELYRAFVHRRALLHFLRSFSLPLRLNFFFLSLSLFGLCERRHFTRSTLPDPAASQSNFWFNTSLVVYSPSA